MFVGAREREKQIKWLTDRVVVMEILGIDDGYDVIDILIDMMMINIVMNLVII